MISDVAPMIDVDAITKEYEGRISRYEDLLRETNFILDSALKERSIKIHNISYRIKEVGSLIKKCEDKQIEDPFSIINDIAGIRIVCLFRSDLKSVEEVISRAFNLISIDNKVENNDGFGYMSVHYICEMRHDYTGPRYDYIRSLKLEIQVRTICMDAWAAVSHYLSYKGDWDVPEDLKRAMNALSGLFYVADNEFLQVYNQSLQSKQEAFTLIENTPKSEIPINLDTVRAYMIDKFPDRNRMEDEEISKAVHQLIGSSYSNIDQINEDINNAMPYFLAYEEELLKERKLKHLFSDVGALRVTLSIANEQMERFRSIRVRGSGYDVTLQRYRDSYLERNKDRSVAPS